VSGSTKSGAFIFKVRTVRDERQNIASKRREALNRRQNVVSPKDLKTRL